MPARIAQWFKEGYDTQRINGLIQARRVSMYMLFRLLPILFLVGVVGFVQAAVSDFMHRDLDGVEYRLNNYKGKWVVVNYWATWCTPCVKEIPDLIDFHNRHQGKDAVVLGVNMEETSDENVKKFLSRFDVSYPMLLAEPDSRTPLGEISGLPTTFIISPDGKVVHKELGRITKQELEDIINSKKSSGNVKR